MKCSIVNSVAQFPCASDYVSELYPIEKPKVLPEIPTVEDESQVLNVKKKKKKLQASSSSTMGWYADVDSGIQSFQSSTDLATDFAPNMRCKVLPVGAKETLKAGSMHVLECRLAPGCMSWLLTARLIVQ